MHVPQAFKLKYDMSNVPDNCLGHVFVLHEINLTMDRLKGGIRTQTDIDYTYAVDSRYLGLAYLELSFISK